jgi:hypothetical protein
LTRQHGGAAGNFHGGVVIFKRGFTRIHADFRRFKEAAARLPGGLDALKQPVEAVLNFSKGSNGCSGRICGNPGESRV